MRKQPVVTDTDRESSDQIKSKEERDVNISWPEPKRKQAEDVQHNNQKSVGPVKAGIFRRSLMWLNCRSGEQKYP